MTEDSYKLLEWGLEEESCLPIKSQSLGAVVQFREKEFLVLGQKEITRFESTVVKESYSYVLTALVPIPKYNILIGITAVSAEFIILFMSDLRKSMMTGIKVNDQSVFNIIYSNDSNTIITSGEHLISWSFHFTPPESSVVFTYPTVKISMKKIILSHIHSSIINSPMFDYQHEEIYINDNKGNIQSYNLDGTSNGIAIKYGSALITTSGFNSKTQYFMTTNVNQGAVLWPKRTGGISKRFFIGTSASLAIQFIDDEYVAILDAKYTITIINIKTSTFFNCYQSKFPVHRMFYFPKPYPRIILCTGTTIILLKVNLPWRFWNPTFGKPISITRCNKKNEAARIAVILENSHVRLISPKTSCILTAATLTSLATPITCFYDRGNFEQLDNNHNNNKNYAKRDQLLIPLQDGSMQIFSTGQDPCQMIGSIDIKITTICQCKFRNEWCFCFGTNVGQLIFYSYSCMKNVGRIVCSYKHPIIGTFYDRESECLILAFKEKVCLLSLEQEKEVGDYMQMKCSKVSLFFDRILIFAGEKGVIGSLHVLNKQLLLHETNCMRLHDDSITGFSLGSTYFVSSSLDKTVKIWSKEFQVICKLVFPLPIFQCCSMNGKRDILVATLNDIMIVKGSVIFGENIDLEDEDYDNYDRKTDFLDNSFLVFTEEEEKGESIFTGRKTKNEKKKVKVNTRRKRIIEALKKQMLMMEKKNNQIENKMEEIDPKPENITNLPEKENNQHTEKKEENSSLKKITKNEVKSSSHEYVLEEKEDNKSKASQPIVQNAQQLNNQEEKEQEKVDKTKISQNDKDEMERKRKLLEKQKADKEREEKEKEIIKIYNDSKREKEIKEPSMNSKPRPKRSKALQPKALQSLSEKETDLNDNQNEELDENDFSKDNQNENEFPKGSQNKNDKKETPTKSKQGLNSKGNKSNKSKTKKGETNPKSDAKMNPNSNEDENEEKTEKLKDKNKKGVSDKSKKKTKTNETELKKDNQDEDEKNQNKDKKSSKNKNTNKENANENNNLTNSKNNENNNKTKLNENSLNNNNDNIMNKINNNKNLNKTNNCNPNCSNTTTNKNKVNEQNLNTNETNKKINQNKTKEKNQDKSDNKGEDNCKDKRKLNEKAPDKSSQFNKNKDNNSQKKSKNKSLKMIKPKPGYKNASSQTVDPSSLKKVCDIPKTVPSNIAIVPQVAKAKRIRRAPTPPTNRPQRERRPLFDQRIARKRSRTPEPIRLLVDGSAPPVNLFFDIEMVRKMAEAGDKRYASLLKLLERQGLKSSNKNIALLPFQRSNQFQVLKNNQRKGTTINAPSWEVMVTLPSINVSQVKMAANTTEETPETKISEETNQQSIIDQNCSNGFIEQKQIDDSNQKDSSYKSSNLNDLCEKLSEDKFSIDLNQNPPLLHLDNQGLQMKKAQNISNKKRVSSVSNVNKTVAEMKYCKEQLMQKLKEKRAKESIQNEEDKETTTSLSNINNINETHNSSNLTDSSLILNNDRKEKSNLESIELNSQLNDQDKTDRKNSLNNNEKVSSENRNNFFNKPTQFGSLKLNYEFSNQMTTNPSSAREPTFVEPIMPIYLRSSKDIRYIKQDGISPFACKRYRMVVDSNGPKDAKIFPSHRITSNSVNNSQNNKKTLFDQCIKAPRQLLKPLQMANSRSKH